MIFKIRDIQNLLSYEKELHADMLREKYIQKAVGDINRSVIRHFGKKYLFHRVYMVSEKKEFEPIIFKDIVAFQNHTSLKHIDFAEEVISSKQVVISFAKIILSHHFQGLVLYKGKRPQQLGNLIVQSFREKTALISLAKKLKVNQKDIMALYGRYKLHSQEIKSDFYAYFIRPFAEHKHYNGVFLILLRRPLLENEFLELGHLWTKVLSETALYKERDAEQELIFEEQTHTWNTEIASITQHLDIAVNKFIPEKGNRLSEEIAEHIQAAYTKTLNLRDINSISLYLMKAAPAAGISPLIPEKMHLADKNMYKEFRVNPVNLKDLLIGVIATLRIMLQSFRYITPDETKKELAALAELESNIKKLKNYTINTIETGLRIIVLDLLKNAMLHADQKQPAIDIKIDETRDEIRIHFINNSRLSQEAFDYINSDKATQLLSLRRKGGLRTIKRILNSRLLSDSDIHWKVLAAETSLTGNTDIILFIPKTDLR